VNDADGPQRRKKGDARGGPQAGLAGLVDFFRSVPERIRRPESLLMLMAILASLGAHMPPYMGLGALADYFDNLEREKPKPEPVEVNFDVASEPASVPRPKPVQPEPLRAQKPKPEKPQAEKPQPVPQPPKKEPDLRISQLELPKQPMPPPEQQRKQSITQKSEDPNVEPPPNAQYLAEENRRVEEETVAKITDETKNDPEPQAAAPQAPGPEESGDSREDERGHEKGGDTNDKVASAAQREPAPPPSAATPPAQPAQPRQAPREAAPPQPMVVHDPMGTFVLAPTRPGQAAQRGKQGSEGSAAPANLKVSWRAFEQTYGAEQLAQDRMPREARRRGAGREKRWSEFRAAVENYVAGVKPGSTTALNAAADPFAAYLAAFHRNLHMEFAHDFLSSLPIGGEFSDPTLVTKVEIVVNPDGTLDRVGVVKSSGNLMYDFGAFNAVQRGAPYQPTPEKIRSPDGRTYMRWALHRNESQCGTWNAEPYILKNPPRSPNDPHQDNVSPYRPGGDSEHGQAPREEPGKGTPPQNPTPAVAPGETLGRLERAYGRARAA
jgi:TonB family protein